MEQAPSLTFSSTTAPPSPSPTPVPAEPTPTASSSSAPPAPSSPTETIRAEGSTSAAESNTAAPQQDKAQHGLYSGSLEEEVGQVIGTLSSWGGGFWGGLKKQSASVLSTVKSDLEKTVSQAQADINYLKTAKVEVVRKEPGEWEAEQALEKERKAAVAAANEAESEKSDKGKGKEKEDVGSGTTEIHLPAAATAFLDRLTASTTQLQHSLTTSTLPQLQQTLQNTIQSATSNPNLSATQLRNQIAGNLKLSTAKENLSISMKQAEKMAEEYMKKSDQWMKDAEKWVEGAVKVIPPSESGSESKRGMSWDGSDWYSFSTKSKERSPRSSMGGGLAGSRKDALLRRLREDKELLMVDPEGAEESKERKEEFAKWVKEKWDTEGKAGKAAEEGNVGAIRMDLDEQFWQRYLFHKHMIEAEEDKRKMLFQATQSQADDFSWDDDEDSPVVATSTSKSTTPTPESNSKLPSAAPVTPDAPAVPVSTTTTESKASQNPASTATSPRDSEESYDLVSDQGKKGSVATPASAIKSTTPIASTPAPASSQAQAPKSDDEDSDWE